MTSVIIVICMHCLNLQIDIIDIVETHILYDEASRSDCTQ